MTKTHRKSKITIMQIIGTICVLIMISLMLPFLTAPSMLVNIKLNNQSETDLDIYVIDIDSKKSKNYFISQKETLHINLCSGEDRESLENNSYIIIGADPKGNIYYQNTLLVKDLEVDETIVIK